MQKSSCEFIAFLDADDYYLPGRFSVAKEIFEADPDCEGVYEVVGMYVENEIGLKRWREAGKPDHQLQTMTKRIAPGELAEALINGGSGSFHLDGFIIKRTVPEKSGYMVETLKLHQDTDFIIRTSLVASLLPGRLDEPVAAWRVHDHNRISAPRSEAQKYNDRMLFWMELYGWCKERHFSEIQQKIMNLMILYTISTKRFGQTSKKYIPRAVLRLIQLLLWLIRYPKITFEPQLWFSIKNVKKL
jgi:hypothetical protein